MTTMTDLHNSSTSPYPPHPGRPALSIVIPALNASANLPATLSSVSTTLIPTELLVVDGGSSDDTITAAEAGGACAISAPRGRGGQIVAGIARARADWLLILHADTRLAEGWDQAVAGYMADPSSERRAAHFRFALDDEDERARKIERRVAWRCRRMALPYGDQGLLIHRRLLESIGGWRPLSLMEDVDIALRLGPRRLTSLDIAAVTSAERYRCDGYRWRPVRNVTLLVLYFMGLPTALLRRLYA